MHNTDQERKRDCGSRGKARSKGEGARMHITAHTNVYCLIGDPIKHSGSPALHNKAFTKTDIDAVYVAFTVSDGKIEEALNAIRTLGIAGGSITMPHKMTCLPYLDYVDPTAKIIGSVNTIVNRNGNISGYNTDGYGCMKSFKDMGATIEGSKMVLIGVGGAGSAIAGTAAREHGLRELVIFNRANGHSWNHAEHLVGMINEQTDCHARLCDLNDHDLLRKEMADAQLVCNATNVGMGKLEGQSVVPDASYFNKDSFVQDVIYFPAQTKFLEMAKEAGCVHENGLNMLFNQATGQFKLWTGVKMPLTVDDLEL